MILTKDMIRDKIYFLGTTTKQELAEKLFTHASSDDYLMLDSLLRSMLEDNILTLNQNLYSTNNLKLD